MPFSFGQAFGRSSWYAFVGVSRCHRAFQLNFRAISDVFQGFSGLIREILRDSLEVLWGFTTICVSFWRFHEGEDAFQGASRHFRGFRGFSCILRGYILLQPFRQNGFRGFVKCFKVFLGVFTGFSDLWVGFRKIQVAVMVFNVFQSGSVRAFHYVSAQVTF